MSVFINGKEIFTDIAAKGIWTAPETLTMPPFTLGGTVTINGQVFDAGSGELKIISTTNTNALNVAVTNAGNDGVIINFQRITSSAGASDTIFRIAVAGTDGAGVDITQWHTYRLITTNVGDGTEACKLQFNLMDAGGLNLAMNLTGAGGLSVDADIGTADDPVALFDNEDDALVLRSAIQQRNHDLLVKLGVFTRKDTGSGYMMNIQPMTRLLAGGIYQNRAKIDDIEERLRRLE